MTSPSAPLWALVTLSSTTARGLRQNSASILTLAADALNVEALGGLVPLQGLPCWCRTVVERAWVVGNLGKGLPTVDRCPRTLG
jgi:hypothetical protein